MDASQAQVLTDQFSDWRWRLNNLYHVIDKDGRRVLFKMNWAQEQLFNDMWYMNTILKARQIGFSTFIQIFMLDACLFNSDIGAATTAHTLDAARSIFSSKIRYPYDQLPYGLKEQIGTVKSTELSLKFVNNSQIQVGTSHRSGTFQYLHISEYGKICAKYPDKAREVRTGSLNTIQSGNLVFIESTAEGQEGDFYDICQAAESAERRGDKLTPLDYKFFFFPWWKEPGYRLDDSDVRIPAKYVEYFERLERVERITLDHSQKAWYVKKAVSQKGDMKREFPSTPKEAFEASIEGAYFGEWMANAEDEGRVGHFPHDPKYPVHTAWDIGVGDNTSIWFFQAMPGEIRCFHFYENHGKFLKHYDEYIKAQAAENGWTMGKAFVPHDIKVREWASGKIRIDEMIAKGLMPELVPNISIEDSINNARNHIPICTFDIAGADDGVQHLKLYRQAYDEQLEHWKPHPRKDKHIHGADAFRYLCGGYQEFKPAGEVPDIPRHPGGEPNTPGERPQVLSELTYEAFHKINSKYERGTRV